MFVTKFLLCFYCLTILLPYIQCQSPYTTIPTWINTTRMNWTFLTNTTRYNFTTARLITSTTTQNNVPSKAIDTIIGNIVFIFPIFILKYFC